MGRAVAPTEIPTLAGVMRDLDQRGFTEQFTVADGRLLAIAHRASFPADQVWIWERYRFEGVSDPDDMAIVYALETGTGVRGTLVDAFGVYADPRVGAFIRNVVLRPSARKLRLG